MSKKKEIDKEILYELYIKNRFPLKKICNILNMSKSTLIKRLQETDFYIKHKKPYKYSKLNLSQYELDVINGCLLGDAHLAKIRNNSGNSNFSYTSSSLQHVGYVFNQIKEFSNDIKFRRVYDKRTHKTYNSYSFRTQLNEAFTELRHKWYPVDKKIIPFDIILNSTVCLFWYIGDGGLQQNYKHNRTDCIKLNTDCFSKDDILNILISQLKEYEAYFYEKTNKIYIPHRKIESFLKFIGDCPFIDYEHKWSMFEYKNSNIEKNGITDHSLKYDVLKKDYLTKNYSIYKLSKKYNIPVKCIKNYFTKNNIYWKPITNKKEIYQFDLKEKLIKIWESNASIVKCLGYNAGAISECCRLKRNTYKGFIWKFYKE